MPHTVSTRTLIRLISNRGTATVELALVLPLLLLLVLGALDLGRAFHADVSITNAAWTGAYVASGGNLSVMPSFCEGPVFTPSPPVGCENIFAAVKKDLATLPQVDTTTNPTLSMRLIADTDPTLNPPPVWLRSGYNAKVTITYTFVPIFPFKFGNITIRRSMLLHVRS
jgi:Flp pilus assembly protein TadG